MEKVLEKSSPKSSPKETKKTKTKLERMKEFNDSKVKKSPNKKASNSSLPRINPKSPNKSAVINNPIPKSQKDRIFYFKNIFTNESLIRHLNGSPARASSTFEEVSRFLQSYSKNEIEIFSLIFLWMTSNISFDATSFYSGNYPDQSPENVFKLGLGVSEGYSSLFQQMCVTVGLRSEKVVGFYKGLNYKEGDDCNKNNHHWNVINCFNTWYIIDSCLGAGSINSERKFNRKLNPFYFLTQPELIISTHRAQNDKWQLLSRAVGVKEFEAKKSNDFSQFFNSAYENNIDLITHSHPNIIVNEKKLLIKFGIKNSYQNSNLNLSAQIKNQNENITEVNATVTTTFDSINQIYSLDVDLIKNGEYSLIIVKTVDGVSLYIMNYLLNVNILITKRVNKNMKNKNVDTLQIQSVNHYRSKSSVPVKKVIKHTEVLLNSSIENSSSDSLISPNKPKCFDNANAYLFEPKNYNNIKIGQASKFKVKVKGAFSVAVLDYKQFHYLKKKGDDIWEGIVNIKTEFISIVSQKSSSLFTEVFEFSNIK